MSSLPTMREDALKRVDAIERIRRETMVQVAIIGVPKTMRSLLYSTARKKVARALLIDALKILYPLDAPERPALDRLKNVALDVTFDGDRIAQEWIQVADIAVGAADDFVKQAEGEAEVAGETFREAMGDR